MFFRGLLRELGNIHGLRFEVRRFKVPRREGAIRTVPVRLVFTPASDRCGGKWQLTFSSEQGVKCESLKAVFHRSRCGLTRPLSFCLPEIPDASSSPKPYSTPNGLRHPLGGARSAKSD